jgi:uncharacterized membrane protein
MFFILDRVLKSLSLNLKSDIFLIKDFLKNNLIIWPFFILVVLLNISVAFFLFFFLEVIHKHLLEWKFYNKNFHKFVEKIRKKQERFEKKFYEIGYLALVLFVAIPFIIIGEIPLMFVVIVARLFTPISMPMYLQLSSFFDDSSFSETISALNPPVIGIIRISFVPLIYGNKII